MGVHRYIFAQKSVLDKHFFVLTFTRADLRARCFVRLIEQCCFNSVPDPFNGQTVNFILKPPKVIESRI